MPPQVTETLSLVPATAYVSPLPDLQTSDTGHHFNLNQLTLHWENAKSLQGERGNYWLMALEGQPQFGKVTLGYRKVALLRDASGQVRARILEVIPDGLWWQPQGSISPSGGRRPHGDISAACRKRRSSKPSPKV